MIISEDPIKYTVDADVMKKSYEQQVSTGGKEKYNFYVIDDINSIAGIPGKSLENGAMEYTHKMRWNKTLDELESQQKNQEEISIRLKNIEDLLQQIYYTISTDVHSIKTNMESFHNTCIELIKCNTNNNINKEPISWWRKLPVFRKILHR